MSDWFEIVTSAFTVDSSPDTRAPVREFAPEYAEDDVTRISISSPLLTKPLALVKS